MRAEIHLTGEMAELSAGCTAKAAFRRIFSLLKLSLANAAGA